MNIVITLLIAIAGLWAIGLFLGAIGGLSKTFTNNAPAIDSSSIKSKEEQTIEDTKDKQQRLMDDIRQKMDDTKQKIEDARQKY